MTEENIYTTENYEKEKNITENVAEENSSVRFSEQTGQGSGTAPETPKTVYVKYVPYGLTPETDEERCKIKTASLATGISFLTMMGVVLLLNLAVIIASYVLDNSMKQYLFEPAVLQVQQIVFSSLSLTLPFVLIFKLFSYRISDLISFKLPEKSAAVTLFLFGVAFCAFANIATSTASQIFNFFNYEVSYPESPEGVFGFLLCMISTVAVPALVEEFACRGILLGALRKFGDGFAIITTSILFGIMHGNFEQMPFAFLVGLALGFATVKSGSIWVAVAIHAFNNFISVFCDYALADFSQQQKNIFIMVLFIILMLSGIVALLFQKQNGEEFYSIKASETVCTEKQKYKWFFASATIIIFIILCLIESVSFFFIN